MAKTKLKPILPALREKKRYVAFEVIAEGQVNFQRAESDINSAAKELVGAMGMAKAGIIFLENKWQNNRGIIKVGHRHVDMLKASIAYAKSQGVIYRSLGVSGILKKAEDRYLKTL